jgi:hypothetical protein
MQSKKIKDLGCLPKLNFQHLYQLQSLPDNSETASVLHIVWIYTARGLVHSYCTEDV